MILTQDEIKKLAENIVSQIVGAAMFEFPNVKWAVVKTEKTQWNAFIDEQVEQSFEVLLTRFGSKD